MVPADPCVAAGRAARCEGRLFRDTRRGLARQRSGSRWCGAYRLFRAGEGRLGVVQANAVMRTLQISDRPTKLAQAIAELGRIDKTIHALTFIDDENKRRRTLIQLKPR
jgi:Tn3 transposase DDE domain